MPNRNLHAAKMAKKDEFYTRLEDIARELRHYREFFRGKRVLCNCDDPYESNFFKYFALMFNAWGLKKLTATCYDGSPVAGQELPLPLFPDEAWGGDTPVADSENDSGRQECRPSTAGSAWGGDTPVADNKKDSGRQERSPSRAAYKIEITEVPDMNGDGATDLADVDLLIRSDRNVLTRLRGNGDFRSPECVEMLREADVVVTNPPFSLFREYVAQLVEHGKKFLIIGPQNAITYKEIFPLIKDNKIWLGYGFARGNAYFTVPPSVIEDKVFAEGVYDAETHQVHFRNCHWFTNIDHRKRHEWLDLYKTYSPEEFPAYDNYDAINVDKTADIPMDYPGVMGVPLTFIDKFNSEQFEIVGITRPWMDCRSKIYGKQIQVNPDGSRQEVSKLNDGAVLEIASPPKKGCHYLVDGKMYIQLYTRILIRAKRR